jgi:hypothetical protein
MESEWELDRLRLFQLWCASQLDATAPRPRIETQPKLGEEVVEAIP